MALVALHGLVEEHVAALDRRCLARGPPRIGRGLDELAARLALPTRREGLDVLDDVLELAIGELPRAHRGAVEAMADDVLELAVGRQPVVARVAELEERIGEVARRRAQAGRGVAVTVAVFAVARAAVV